MPRLSNQVCGVRGKGNRRGDGAAHLDLARADDCDSIVILSGDTDILPAIRAARAIAPAKQLLVGFPYRRFNHELRTAATGHFKIRPDAYARHQLPNPVIAPDGNAILKPEGW